MKKAFSVANAVLVVANLIGGACYWYFGGLRVKTIASLLFVLLGLVNVAYAVKTPARNRKFPAVMLSGLFFAMLGDVTLGKNFILGAALFALGHALYFAAFCTRTPFQRGDLLPSAIIFAGSAAFLLLYPQFDFGGAVMQAVCMVYALIISGMVGKAFSNLRRENNRTNAIIAVGSAMFYFSDLMLVLFYFADAPRIVDTLCLFTYYPGQCVLAHSLYHHVRESAA